VVGSVNSSAEHFGGDGGSDLPVAGVSEQRAAGGTRASNGADTWQVGGMFSRCTSGVGACLEMTGTAEGTLRVVFRAASGGMDSAASSGTGDALWVTSGAVLSGTNGALAMQVVVGATLDGTDADTALPT